MTDPTQHNGGTGSCLFSLSTELSVFHASILARIEKRHQLASSGSSEPRQLINAGSPLGRLEFIGGQDLNLILNLLLCG